MKLICVSSGSQNGNCYLLQSEGKYIILDCGVKYETIAKACNYMVGDIDFALVTHTHKDHAIGIPQLLRHGIDVFTNHEVRDLYSGCKWLGRNKTASLCGWKITAFVVPHTHNDGEKCLNYAYIIEKEGQRLLYMTDWMYCPFNLSKFRIDHFLIAVNYTDLEEDADGNIRHILQGHSSLKTAKEFLKTSMTPDCKSVIACHLSQRNADEKQILLELNELVHTEIAKKGTIHELL